MSCAIVPSALGALPGDRPIAAEGLGIVAVAQAPKIAALIHHSGAFHPMASSPKSQSAAPASYEAALQELEQLVARLESGELPLAQLLTQYQRGAELLKFCRNQLQAVEDQIKVLDQGVLKPWTPE